MIWLALGLLWAAWIILGCLSASVLIDVYLCKHCFFMRDDDARYMDRK